MAAPCCVRRLISETPFLPQEGLFRTLGVATESHPYILAIAQLNANRREPLQTIRAESREDAGECLSCDRFFDLPAAAEIKAHAGQSGA